MGKIKQTWLIARCGVRESFTDTRMIVVLLVLGFIYDNGARQMMLSAKQVGAPLGMFEAFIMCLNDWRYSVVFLLGFLFFYADLPRVSNEYISFVYRAGKKVWLAGETLHLFIMSVFYTMTLLGLCLLGVSKYSFVGNVWSRYVTGFQANYKHVLGTANTVDESVYRYQYPYQTAIHAFALIVLCLTVLGSVVIMFSIINKKIIGMIIVVLLIGCMVIFTNYRIRWMWMLPTSHSVIFLHHVFVYKKYMIELKYSYLFLLGAEVFVLTVSAMLLKKKNYF